MTCTYALNSIAKLDSGDNVGLVLKWGHSKFVPRLALISSRALPL